jgi:hypothetical protein
VIAPAKPTPAPAPAANAIVIDLAEVVRESRNQPMPPMPQVTAMHQALLAEARKCAEGRNEVQPRRELIATALKEAAREQWFRDHAELALQALRVEHSRLKAENEKLQVQLADARTARHGALQSLFEIVAWASTQLNCAPLASTVLERIRATRAPSPLSHAPHVALAPQVSRASGTTMREQLEAVEDYGD